MKVFKQALKYLYDAKFRLNVNSILGFNHYLSDEEFLKRAFKLSTGYDLNLENPQTFNEKLQWLKIHNRKPEYTVMVDKYKVKQYIAEKIGEQYVIPLLGVWDNANDIDFDKLPNQFVLKCNHNSGGGMYICKDKSRLNEGKIRSIRKNLNKNLSINYFWMGREWPHKNVERKIIAEKYMEDANTEDLMDYKLMCFNGEVKYTFVCTESFSEEKLRITFYDRDWNIMPFVQSYPRMESPIEKPECYEEMVKIAEKLSKGIPCVRVDFYYVNGQVYFGELTFFDGGGMSAFHPKEWDYKIGEWIKLPDLNK